MNNRVLAAYLEKWRRDAMMGFYMVKEIIFDFINVVIEKTFAITVISSIFVRNVNARYEYVYFPFILAVIYVLSYIPIYINEDMTIKQILLQRAAGLLMLEITMCFVVSYSTGGNLPGLGYVAVILFTAFFDALSYMTRWYLDMEKADMINRKIAERRRMTNGK